MLERVRSGTLPWTKLDDLHRMALDQLLVQFGVIGLTEEEIDHLNRAWHRLDPWHDTVPGLVRLRRKFILATLSNGNVALLVNMAKRAGLPWDAILGAEVARHYKPQPAAYRTTAERSEEHTSELQSLAYLVCRLLLEKKKKKRAVSRSRTSLESSHWPISCAVCCLTNKLITMYFYGLIQRTLSLLDVSKTMH